jgi:DNA-binding IclR family transcriptional regulator
MTSASPPTRRVVNIIEFLTARGDVPTRLSDIVAELDLNQATAHTILKELVDTGWVTRDPVDKTFSVGAALVRLARRLDSSPDVTHSAHAVAADAAATTGYAASVSERADDELVITAFIAGGNGHWSAAVGDRLPYAAPFGPAYAAWEPPEERRAWIQRSGVSSRKFEAQLLAQLDEIREQGFGVERLNPELAAAIPIMTKLRADTLSDSVRDHLREVLVELTGTSAAGAEGREGRYVGAVTAPVFDQRGRVTHNICVHPFTALSPRRLVQIGRRLSRAAEPIRSHA